jgi:hypothetical protein
LPTTNRPSRPTQESDPVMGTSARESMIAKEFNENDILASWTMSFPRPAPEDSLS